MTRRVPEVTELFDTTAFEAALGQGHQPATHFREAVDAVGTALNDYFRQGVDINWLVHARACVIDEILRVAWRHFGLHRRDDLCLSAVGGYGRAELHPHSDIDVLILLDDSAAEGDNDTLERFVTLLWDMRLDIGHSVRTLSQCTEEAAKDITIVTNLMESRPIIGNASLHTAMMRATGPDRIWPSAEFYRAKWEEQIIRHNKYANTEYNLEPNIKSSPGGLRDIQMIGWIAKRHFNTAEIDALVARGFLTKEEYRLMNRGREYLWRVRWALHMISGRAEDRLLFDHQGELARLFGQVDDDKGLAVEKFMQTYYRWAMALGELNDLLVQLFDEAILRACEPEQLLEINQRFRIRNRYIEACNDRVFRQMPSAILEMFVLMAQNETIIGPRAATIRLIREARGLIDEQFRADPRNRQLFLELLRSPRKVATQLRRMNRYGILGRYLPEFGRIVGKMQHDLFHIYTVDAHTIEVIKNMRLLTYPDYAEKFPLAASVARRLPRSELLYIAGLYHDIAKGRGGDHSDLGAVDAERFCHDHGINARDTQLVVWLVKNHLIMSAVAQRRDISDPEVIRDFALTVGDQLHLDYLYALTVADINATNPNLWNTWRASLLRQLYLETKRALRRGLGDQIDKQEWIDEAQEAAIRILEDRGFDADEVLAIWNAPGDDYFLSEAPADIAWHTEAIARQRGHDPLILIKDTTNRLFEGATQVFVYTPYQRHLFALVASVFENLNLSIQDARINRSADGYAMDSYIILEASGEPIGDNPGRMDEIRRTLRRALADPTGYREVTQKHVPRQLKHFAQPTEVTIMTDVSKEQTVIEVITPDRPGLLARIGRIFVDFDVLLQNAKISTLGERVEDVFFITDTDGQPIEDQHVLEAMRQAICQQLDKQIAA